MRKRPTHIPDEIKVFHNDPKAAIDELFMKRFRDDVSRKAVTQQLYFWASDVLSYGLNHFDSYLALIEPLTRHFGNVGLQKLLKKRSNIGFIDDVF